MTRPVNANSVRKSLGGELTYFDDKRSEDELREALDEIIDIVWDRIERYQARGKTLVLKARYSDFPHDHPVAHCARTYWADRAEFAQLGHALLDQILPAEMGIRLLGLTLGSLVDESGSGEDVAGAGAICLRRH
jgi:DNA polymerase-4